MTGYTVFIWEHLCESPRYGCVEWGLGLHKTGRCFLIGFCWTEFFFSGGVVVVLRVSVLGLGVISVFSEGCCTSVLWPTLWCCSSRSVGGSVYVVV